VRRPRKRGELRVLSSEPTPGHLSNPYIAQLFTALDEQAGVVAVPFSLRTVLLGRFDVLHIHWPETLVRKRTTFRSVVAAAILVVLLLRLRVAATPIVRTVHNVRPHEDLHGWQGWLMRRLLRGVVAEVHLTPSTVAASRAPLTTVIPHGDYRAWFSKFSKDRSVPGRVVYFGLLRPYKGVDNLIRAFKEVDDASLTLHIAGRAADDSFLNGLQEQVARDDRVSLEARFLDDEELVRFVTQAELVVLPYRYLVNSGVAVLSLSLNRPVLVPDSATARELLAETGAGWVSVFSGVIGAQDIEDAIGSVRSSPNDTAATLTSRDWATGATKHVEVYRAALAVTSRRRRF
jgi:beta-1,4-mannosyltransferase